MTDEKPGYTPVNVGDPFSQPPDDPSSEPALPPKPALIVEPPPPYYPPVGQGVILRNGQIQPDDYMWFSIWVTVCCCILGQGCVLPCGIVGIVKASEVRSRFNSGDFKGAEASSQSAKLWSTVAMVTAIIQLIILFTIGIVCYVAFVRV